MLGSLAGAPLAAAAIPSIASAAAQATTAPAAAASEEFPKLTSASMEDGAAGVVTFFTAAQLDALRKLGDLIMPAANGRPAASDAGVPEFLDFLIRQSPPPVQSLYREGLDRLVRDGVSERSLAPLKNPWSYAGPADRFAQFLERAKMDILQATTNSREWAEAQGRGRRGSSPSGYYWRSLD